MSYLDPVEPDGTIWVDGKHINNVGWAKIDKKTHKLTLDFMTTHKTYPRPVIAVFHFPRYLNDRVDFITNEDHLKEAEELLKEVKELQKYRLSWKLVPIDKEIKQENPYRAMMRQLNA